MPQLITLCDYLSYETSRSSLTFAEPRVKDLILDSQNSTFTEQAGFCGMQRTVPAFAVGSVVSDLPQESRYATTMHQAEIVSARRVAGEQHLNTAVNHLLVNGEVDSGNDIVDVENGVCSTGASSSDGQSSTDAKYGDYNLVQHEMLNDRYYVVEFLGRGTFGQVVKCVDKTTQDYVAVKILKNHPSYVRQGQVEVSILRALNVFCADRYNFVLSSEWFSHRGHSCVVFEMLQLNLYDFLKQSNFQPMRLQAIRPILQQVATALCKLKDLCIIHADLKPENIMLVDQDRLPYRIKVIDFGSALHSSKAVSSTYLQSRYYRAPEVILSLPFAESIDVWSLGCVIAELFLGWPLFPGASEYMQMKYIVETVGMVPPCMIEESAKRRKFFRQNFSGWMLNPSHGNGDEPKEARKYILHSLADMTGISLPQGLDAAEQDVEIADKEEFVRLLRHMLTIDPMARVEPANVLNQPFLTGSHLAALSNASHAHQRAVQMALEPMAVCDKPTATHRFCPVHNNRTHHHHHHHHQQQQQQQQHTVQVQSTSVATVLTPMQSPQTQLTITHSPVALPTTAMDPMTQARNLVFQRLNGGQVFLNTPTHTCRENVHAPIVPMPLRVPYCVDAPPQVLLPTLPGYVDTSNVGNESMPAALITLPGGPALLPAGAAATTVQDCPVTTHADPTMTEWTSVSRPAWPVASSIPNTAYVGHISSVVSNVPMAGDSTVVSLANSMSNLSHAGAHNMIATRAQPPPYEEQSSMYHFPSEMVYGSSARSSGSSAPDHSRGASPSDWQDLPLGAPSSRHGHEVAYSNRSAKYFSPQYSCIESSQASDVYAMDPSSVLLHRNLSKSFSSGTGSSRLVKQPRGSSEKVRVAGSRSRFLSLGNTPPGGLHSHPIQQVMSSEVLDTCNYEPSSASSFVTCHQHQHSAASTGVYSSSSSTLDQVLDRTFRQQFQPTMMGSDGARHGLDAGLPVHHQRTQSYTGSSLSMSNLQSVPSPDSIGPVQHQQQHQNLASPFITPLITGVPVAAASLSGTLHTPLSAPAIAGPPQPMFVFPSNPVAPNEVLLTGPPSAVAYQSPTLSSVGPMYSSTAHQQQALGAARTVVRLDPYQAMRT
ncbi:homeodomain-interacting protein kinase 2-like [Sycon ciliatum]|uniref:homeodomain-interacting protein kinase 2-like n=1 Tax=Sycon ciliatum TaxID=27933 RepID=UPI0031F68472